MQQASDDGAFATLDNVQHATLGSALAIVPHHAYANSVAMHERTHLLRAEIDVRFSVITPYETVAIAVARNGALDLADQATTGHGD